jgi:phage-related minor tail protein
MFLPPKDKSDDVSLTEREQQRKRQLETLISLSGKFGDSLSTAFAKNVAEGKKLDDVLKSLRTSLIESTLKLAMAPLQAALTRGVESLMGGLFETSGLKSAPMSPDLSSLGSGIANLFGSLFGGAKLARGGLVSRGMVMPFAEGGVVAAPTYFPLGRGLGLMGERGAEAVMPLARGPDGRLGVRGGSGARPVSVTVNISTPDAQSFRRSEAQVSAALARAVSRGQRGM